MTNDTLEYKIIQQSEISDKKCILHKDLELSNKKSVQSNKMVIPKKEYKQDKSGSFHTRKLYTQKKYGDSL